MMCITNAAARSDYFSYDSATLVQGVWILSDVYFRRTEGCLYWSRVQREEKGPSWKKTNEKKPF